MENLEENIQRAQKRDTDTQEMTSWLSEVTTLLQARLDADILAGEVPEEFEQVRAEFAQHEAVMASLKETCEVYRKEGKLEAAERCEQQTAVLKVSRKFLFQHLRLLFQCNKNPT